MMEMERKKLEPPKYVKVQEVMQLCEVSESRAYRIMQKLNKELEAKGAYKDTVDALVQGILYLMDKPSVTGPPQEFNSLTKESYWRK